MSKWSRPALAEVFRRRSLRLTPQRFAVLEHLMAGPRHATAEEIHQAINATDPRASRATVYNNLHALKRAGLVREVVLAGGAVRYDASVERHHHFVCEGCGALEDIGWFELPQLGQRSQLGMRRVRDYEIVFRGLCRDCAEKGPGRRAARGEE